MWKYEGRKKMNSQVYLCRYCGGESPGFSCSCEKDTKVWNYDERKRNKSKEVKYGNNNNKT